MTIEHQGQLLGSIREVPVCCTRKHLEVWDKNDQKIFDISGPCCPISCGGDVPFLVYFISINLFSINLSKWWFTFCQIENAAGITVGEITKKWRGCCAEAFTDTDTFKIDFPDNIDVTTKAILMGATMLVVRFFMIRLASWKREVISSTF